MSTRDEYHLASARDNGVRRRNGCSRARVLPVAPSTTAAGAIAAKPANISLCVPVRKIATFHLNGLGDLLFTLPALLALRENFPGAHITAVLRPGLIPLLQGSRLVDEIVPRPKGGLSGQASLMVKLHARHLDLAVAFSQSRNTILLVFSTRAPVRVGYNNSKMEALLTHHVPKAGPPSTIDSHLDLVREVGCQTRQHDYCGLVEVSPQATQSADALLREYGIEGQFILAACEASERRGIKEWPEEHWAAALDQLSERWPVLLVGTRPTVQVTGRMTKKVADAGGRTDLATLAALCGKAALFIGIDSGVMHLAAAMETPVVAIFGPTSWSLTAPRGVPHRIVRHPVDCSPCLLSNCKWSGDEERKCLTRLEPEQVVQAARELLGV